MRTELLQKRLKVAQTQLLLTNMKVHNAAALVVSTLIFAFLYQALYKPILVPWYILLISATLVRLHYVLKFQHLSRTELEEPSVARILAVLTFVCGCLWGCLSFMYIDAENTTVTYIVLMLFTGLVANASVSLGSDLRVYLALIVPILLPTALKLFTLPGTTFQLLAILLLLYSGVGIVSTRNIRDSLQRSNLLHLLNGDLIEDLQSQIQQTQAALAKAESANRAKSRFFAAANHDLRQPLQSLSMFTTTLSTQTESKHQQKIISYIDKSVRSLESLFNRLLDVSTLEAGTMKVRMRNVRLKPFIEELATEFIDVAGKRKLDIEVDVSNDVVYTDPILLGRIVRNLVDNAVRYTTTGGVKIVTVTKDKRIKLSVIDTGIGISNEQKDLIFEEFVQLNNPGRDRSKGLGLGLSIVRRSCELLDLQLNVDTDRAVGTTFTIELLVSDSAECVPQESNIKNLTQSLNNMFVLVIDDEEDIQTSMESLLSVWGCAVMVASSGQEAVQQLKEYESMPDAIITDYRLQNNETGADALRLVKQYCQRDIPAIVITGDTSADRLIDINNLGLPVLHKPCNSSELFECLSNAKTNSDALASAG